MEVMNETSQGAPACPCSQDIDQFQNNSFPPTQPGYYVIDSFFVLTLT